MTRLAIVSTHPIQYNAPFFKLLAINENIQIKVFYTWEQAQFDQIFDPGFNRMREWDIPLLDGYDFVFLKNIASKPGSHHFWGINNPTAINEISDWRPSAILVYGWSFYTHLRLLFHFKKKIPVYFRGDSTLLNEIPGFRKSLRRIFLRFIYRKIDYALYVGANNRDYFLANGLKEDQLIFAPHAIDNRRFSEGAEKGKNTSSIMRQQLGITPDEIVFLYCGKFEETKNLLFLISAFMNAAIPKTHLMLVGEGILEEKLKHKAADFNNIHFLPFQNQSKMPEIYGFGDIFILASKGETWGLGINEAMACGLAIIVSNKVGCAPDLVENGSNGYIFDYDDLESLISKMRELTYGGLSQMKQSSLRKISHYSFDISAVNFLDKLNAS